MNRRIAMVVLVLMAGSPTSAQFIRSYSLTGSQAAGTNVPSNSVSHLIVNGTDIWIGTAKGLARSTDASRSWTSFRSDPAFTQDGVFAISSRGDTIWSATGFEKEISGGSVQTGAGYAYTTDNGLSWKGIPQTIDSRGDSILRFGINDSLWILPIVVPEQNVTFDIALSGGTVWIASWASGLRKSTDMGATWQRIILPKDNMNSISPDDTLWSYAAHDTLHSKRIFERFDPRQHNNMLAFSVYAVDQDTIWCGTAGGVNKSTDGGRSWVRFTRQNQIAPILGNWVIAIREQRFGPTKRIWTTNWKASAEEESFGVSFTEDGGRTWKNLLHGIRAYDFAFKGATAYIATDDGLYRTTDGGTSFAVARTISDPLSRQIITSRSVFTVGVLGDTVYVGTGDGLASTIDDGISVFGASWHIARAYQPLGVSATSYAYPNPFSPAFETVRIHCGMSTSSPGGTRTLSIEIFDFGMSRIRTLLLNASRPSDSELDEVWDGRDDGGNVVPNGVYFYRLTENGNDPTFGKILVLQ